MPLWGTLKGLVVINDIPDEEGAVQQVPACPAKEPKPDKIKNDKVETPEEDGGLFRETEEPSCTEKLFCSRTALVVYFLLLCLFLGLLLPFILSSTVLAPPSNVLDQRGYCYINDTIKYSCFGGKNETEALCEDHGCCYEISENPLVPSCYHSEPSEYGYEVYNASNKPLISLFTKDVRVGDEFETKTVTRSLYRLDNDQSMTLNLKPVRGKSPYGDIWDAQIVVERGGDDVISLTVSSPGHEEGTLVKDPVDIPSKAENPKLDVEITQDTGGAFNVTVHRYGNKNQVLFSTILGPMILGDGYMEITTTVPSSNVYGLGSRLNTTTQSPLFNEYEEWTLNSRDPTNSNISLPATHPFYITLDHETTATHGVYVRTSSPLQVVSVPAPGLSFRSNLGSIRFLVFAGPNPVDVSRQYTSLIGKPELPPFWAFGFHLCRTTDPEIQKESYLNTAKAMAEAKLPFDSDCLNARLSYPDPFAPMPAWASLQATDLVKSGRKFLAVSYPFVVDGTPAYDEAASTPDVLIKREGEPYFGQIGKSAVGYPDYLDENSYDEWLSNSAPVADRFRNSGGVILLQNSPLNEAAMRSLDIGVCNATYPEYCCSRSKLEFQVDPSVADVSDGTICWDATHASLDYSKHLAHHNSYGMYHTKRIHQFMKDKKQGERPVIVSSSTHPGSGQYGGQFSEGFGNSIAEQKRALLQVLELGLNGVPLVGTPVCGSRNDTVMEDDEWLSVCLRSYQMAIFFPFFLSHYELDCPSTNPPDVAPGFAMQLRPFVLLRYMLAPTLYTLAEEASREGTPVIRSLYYQFPDDPNSLTVFDEFMVGSSLLVVPNFENVSALSETIEVPAYFPPGYWYNLFSGMLVSDSSNGSYATLPTVFSDINTFIKGGEALFLQGNLHQDILHTGDSRKNDFTVVIAVAENETTAKGHLYHDDGKSLVGSDGYQASKPVALLKLDERELIIKHTPVYSGDVSFPHYCTDFATHSTTVTGVVIFGLPTVKQMFIDGKELSFTQENDSMTVRVSGLTFDWCSKASVSITWTY